MRSLRTDQLQALSRRTVAALTPVQLRALSAAQLGVLLPDQVAALSAWQVQVLASAGQLGALPVDGRARLVQGGQLRQALNLQTSEAAIQAGVVWAVRQANHVPPDFLMQRLPPRSDRPTPAPRPTETVSSVTSQEQP
ncbi:hypothetical protein [Sphaerotilus mobilis]|uniref:Uncharacterized protein n=1 Tax=Sphaerotilus mobilis TaxID=47994 RepID=A0A4Q7LB43_9BURK|nr:hypothetical protein [Sphaerotilus mobilis]RZS47375.1 hypothetical protein EV685_3578 [Sphaerotilus mobilis]